MSANPNNRIRIINATEKVARAANNLQAVADLLQKDGFHPAAESVRAASKNLEAAYQTLRALA